LKSEKFTVLGANGFIGGYLCRELAGSGCRVNAFDRTFDNSLLDGLGDGMRFYTGDIADGSLAEEVISDTDVLFHLACTTTPATSDEDAVYDITSNLAGTVKILSLCVKHKVKKVIFPSSGGTVYGIQPGATVREDFPVQPICSYGVTKLAVEKYLHVFEKKYGLKYIVLRLANPYGPKSRGFSQGVVTAFIKNILEGTPLNIWGNGEVVRDFVYIDDVVSAFISSVRYEGGERVFNIGSGVGTSINRLIDILESCTGKKCVKRYHPPRSCDVPSICLDISKAGEYLGWFPAVSIEDGVRMTYEAMRLAFETGRLPVDSLSGCKTVK